MVGVGGQSSGESREAEGRLTGYITEGFEDPPGEYPFKAVVQNLIALGWVGMFLMRYLENIHKE